MNRLWRAVVLGAVVLSLVSTGCQQAPDYDPSKVTAIWGSQQHTGVFETEPLRTFKGTEWEFQTLAPSTWTVVEAGGVGYVGDWGGVLYAVDLDKGEELWRFEAGSKLYNAPVVLNGVAYIGCSDSTVYAIDTGTGEEIWGFKTEGGICSPPALHNGIAYAGSHDDNLYLIDLATGEESSRIEERYDLCCSPTVVGDVIFYPDWGGNLHALDSVTQEKLWTFEIDDSTQWITAPAISGGVAYHVKYDSTLHAIDIETGEELWTFQADGILSRAPAVKDEYVVVMTIQSHLYALRAASGEMVWDLKPEAGNESYAKPVITGDVVYFAGGDMKLRALDLSTGEQLWSYQAGGTLGTPLPYRGKVLFTSGNTLALLR